MRYFYTNPLAAAWMSKYFDINFIGFKSPSSIYPIFDLTSKDPIGFVYNKNEKKFYVHPDKAYFFKPNIGDYIEYISDSGCAKIEIITEIISNHNNLRIIQRKGIPFIHPEIEND